MQALQRLLIRLMILPVAVVIATVVALIAVAFFILALFLFLAELMMSPPLAALATGGIILLVAVLIVVIGRAIASPKRAVKKTAGDLGSADSAAAIGSVFGRKLHGYATSNKSSAAIAALILGVAVGYSPKLRNFLLDLLRK